MTHAHDHTHAQGWLYLEKEVDYAKSHKKKDYEWIDGKARRVVLVQTLEKMGVFDLSQVWIWESRGVLSHMQWLRRHIIGDKAECMGLGWWLRDTLPEEDIRIRVALPRVVTYA